MTFKFQSLRYSKADSDLKMGLFHLQNAEDGVLKKGEYIPMMRSHTILSPENSEHCEISIKEKEEFLQEIA